MKISIEYDKDENFTPIGFAKAVIDFMLFRKGYDKLWVRDFKETIEYLKVCARFLPCKESDWEEF